MCFPQIMEHITGTLSVFTCGIVVVFVIYVEIGNRSKGFLVEITNHFLDLRVSIAVTGCFILNV